MRAFITGTAGFIGFHLASRLLSEGHEVTGFDGLTDYYDVRLKRTRHAFLGNWNSFSSVIGKLEDLDVLRNSIGGAAPDIVVHLAAQAGVRYSLEHPETYVSSNLVGTFNLLEALRATAVQHAIIASSSSVYGANPGPVFVETDRTDFPVSIYAATKRGVESMAHSYSHLFGIPITMARFFTVYGPWGRPDMAPIKFARAIESGTPIQVYGSGSQQRDFTYIDDVVEAIVRLLDKVPTAGNPLSDTDTISPVAPWRAVNVAGGHPIGLMDFIAAFEKAMEKKARMELLPMQPGDVKATHADVTLLKALTGFVPATAVDEGVRQFCSWYKAEYAGNFE